MSSLSEYFHFNKILSHSIFTDPFTHKGLLSTYANALYRSIKELFGRKGRELSLNAPSHILKICTESYCKHRETYWMFYLGNTTTCKSPVCSIWKSYSLCDQSVERQEQGVKSRRSNQAYNQASSYTNQCWTMPQHTLHLALFLALWLLIPYSFKCPSIQMVNFGVLDHFVYLSYLVIQSALLQF